MSDPKMVGQTTQVTLARKGSKFGIGKETLTSSNHHPVTTQNPSLGEGDLAVGILVEVLPELMPLTELDIENGSLGRVMVSLAVEERQHELVSSCCDIWKPNSHCI